MTVLQSATRQVQATVLEVLPATGLAYVTDDAHRTWGITRSTRGACFANLKPGQRVELTVTGHTDFDLVSAYASLN